MFFHSISFSFDLKDPFRPVSNEFFNNTGIRCRRNAKKSRYNNRSIFPIFIPPKLISDVLSTSIPFKSEFLSSLLVRCTHAFYSDFSSHRFPPPLSSCSPPPDSNKHSQQKQQRLASLSSNDKRRNHAASHPSSKISSTVGRFSGLTSSILRSNSTSHPAHPTLPISSSAASQLRSTGSR